MQLIPTQRKDGANNYSILSPQRNCHCYNNALQKYMKAMVRYPDGDTNFLNIVTKVLQRDTLVPYIFIICLDYVS